MDPPPERAALRRAGRGAGAASSRRRGFRRCSRANALSVAGWRPLYAACRERANEVQRDLDGLLAARARALEGEWPRGLPQGVIHADLFPDNVFFLGDTLSGLIDFYFACTDTLVYDVAICLNAWCFEADHSYNVTKGRALLQATPRPGICRRRNGRNCRSFRAARRCAFCSRGWSIGSTCRRARWCGRRIRSNICASSASTRKSTSVRDYGVAAT